MRKDQIFIEYLDSILSDKEINSIIEGIPSSFNVFIKSYNNRIINAAFDDILTTITIFITPELISSLFSGIIANGIITGLRSVAMGIKHAVEKKTICKVTTHGAEEQQPSISIKTRNVNIILPVNVSDEKFMYCIDKAFEDISLNGTLINENETITVYHLESDTMVTYSVEDYYWSVVYPRDHNERSKSEK